MIKISIRATEIYSIIKLYDSKLNKKSLDRLLKDCEIKEAAWEDLTGFDKIILTVDEGELSTIWNSIPYTTVEEVFKLDK